MFEKDLHNESKLDIKIVLVWQFFWQKKIKVCSTNTAFEIINVGTFKKQ